MPEPLLLAFKDTRPELHATAWAAPGACLIGAVRLEAGASVWFNAVLRADLAPIVIGAGSNVQDGTVIHVDPAGPCLVGENVVIGHRAVLHACSVGDGALIGMGAIILSGARIGPGAVVAAGALIKENSTLEAGCLYAGNPARLVRPLTETLKKRLLAGATLYGDLVRSYRDG